MSNISPPAPPPAQPPGLAVEVIEVKPGNRSALRSDVAGFLGRTRRGPLRIGENAKPHRVRVQGQRGYNTVFGAMMLGTAVTPYSINGYFENEGHIAHVIRLGGPETQTAAALWDISGQLAGGSLDLVLMHSVTDLKSLPTTGKNLVIVADTDLGGGSNILHFRIFDAAGNRVVDTDENPLTDLVTPLTKLRNRLNHLMSKSQLTTDEKNSLVTSVTKIVGWGSLDSGFLGSQYQFYASSPGSWANNAQITLTYSRQGVSGTPSIDVVTQVIGETTEIIRGIVPETLVRQINETSLLVRVAMVDGTRLPRTTGLTKLSATQTLTLKGGNDGAPTLENYLNAIQSMSDEPEVALVVMPDLFDDITNDDDRRSVLAEAVALADSRQDRLVLVDVPQNLSASQDIIIWVKQLQVQCIAASTTNNPDTPRSAAVYHPWLWVPDPLGTTPEESRKQIPPSGHVAGLISRLDRQRGAQYTPANAPLLQTFDIARSYRPSERAVLNSAGVNLIRCFPNEGLLVWGGRTLGTEPGDLYVAHRRLLHRLVRAIRAVAEPLVFDVNGPELRLTLVRAITTVLLQVYRAGGLAGATPDQAFQVLCDDQTNPPDAIDTGQVVCLVKVAPAIPMEFITLRVSLNTEGRLEVLQ
jgi:phage tail sheath protein FI